MVKKIKSKINGWLLVKLGKTKKENKVLRKKIAEDVLKEQEYIDKITLMQGQIRSLKLKVEDYELCK